VHITADVETEPVKDSRDAADDPSIWIHPEDPSKSLLFCSNKQWGIAVYNLEGKEIANYPVGRINNIDVRQGVNLNDSTKVDIVAGSNRSDNTITVRRILDDGSLEEILANPIQSDFSEVYGFCLYHDLENNALYAIVNDKKGMVEQWLLYGTENMKMDAELSRTFRAGKGQLEGCVGDDEMGFLYIGEENHGIWKFRAHPDSAVVGTLVDDLSNKALKADIEGLTIFYKENGKGFLLVSSQGNNSFGVYTRENDNQYLGSFALVDDDNIDGAEDTDGIDVTGVPLGPAFPNGIFVVQDGFNFEGKKKVNQNFKIVSWDKIVAALNLE
jgi:3-phytase